VGDATVNSIARSKKAKELLCEVTASHYGGYHASYGESVEYVVYVKNLGNESKTIEITFQENTVVKIVAENQTVSLVYKMEVKDSSKLFTDKPKVTVNDKDFSVYSLFVGYGVVTPEHPVNYGIRCSKIKRSDLMPGDIILVSDDPYGTKTYSSFYTGKKLIGRFRADENSKCIENSEIDRFVDSLFGRFCFVILRP